MLGQVLSGGRILDDALGSEPRLVRLDARDRAFARNLAATVLRRLGQIDSVIDSCLDRPLPRSGAGARMALRLGVCQVLFLDTQTHAAVDTSVALARRHGPEKFAGVVNAILRRVARGDRERLLARHPPSLNVPDWLGRSWAAAYGEEAAAAIAAAHLAHPPLDLTVRSDPAAWAERLGGEHLWADSVRIRSGGAIPQLAGYGDGAWWVQDVAATLPARLLARSAAPGVRVCDMCAAPGGKTAQLAAAGFDVTAVDISPERLDLVANNLARLGLPARLVAADAADWTPPHPFDAVLVDAPCSATGTIRRHPDIPLVRTHADVARLAGVQARLLGAASALAAPGRRHRLQRLLARARGGRRDRGRGLRRGGRPPAGPGGPRRARGAAGRGFRSRGCPHPAERHGGARRDGRFLRQPAQEGSVARFRRCRSGTCLLAVRRRVREGPNLDLAVLVDGQRIGQCACAHSSLELAVESCRRPCDGPRPFAKANGRACSELPFSDTPCPPRAKTCP